MKPVLNLISAAVVAGLLSACGGGGGDDPPANTVAPLAAPSIATGPVSQSVTSGGSATFSVSATGAGTLSYQWQLNGTNITGATSASYTTPVVDLATSGSTYRVVVSNAGGSTSSTAATLTVTAAPAGILTDSQSTATALAEEAYDTLDAAQRKSELPGGIQMLGLPAGVTTTINCGVGGSYTVDYPDSFSANTQYSAVYNNCQFVAGYVFSGAYVIRYSNFSDIGNFSWVATYDLRYTGPNGFNYTYAGTQSCSYVNSVASCTYNDGERNFSSNFSYTGGRVNGSYSWNYSSEVSVTYSCSNWTNTSGTITVTASNGFTATIVRTGLTTFTVTINGGTPRMVTITR